MKGAPANPISGTRSSRRSRRIVSSTIPSSSRGSKRRSAATSAPERIGLSITGPSPLWKSNGSPSGASGTSRSEKRIAASSGNARIGCSVTSTASSGVRTSSSSECFSRSARYSGM